MVYLITYDLKSSGQNYDDVIQSIKDASIGTWCTYWKSSFLLKSNLTANQISEKITPFLDANDSLIIVEVRPSNYQGWLSQEQWDFINQNVFS